MENKKALKLIDKIISNLDASGINTDSMIDDLKELRTYALEQQVPLVVKVLRLTYEHIEENDSFMIPIPDDEPIEDQEVATVSETTLDPVESLSYMLSLIKDLNNRMNISDLKDYRNALNEF
ncbi:hypothetical protein [Aquimarina sp. 2201CG5-10]|uniref:hypothetical protein n=1 Tax=Aquimarina callyspongiae TaxID=3098150 RepID=UPI002AB4999B|nr:hypothetical protein [Aquimarina sp. 2201CG5-10]MDY8136209.1 hypothetical protein [Aquimarina sp. 2201CG5-10]